MGLWAKQAKALAEQTAALEEAKSQLKARDVTNELLDYVSAKLKVLQIGRAQKELPSLREDRPGALNATVVPRSGVLGSLEEEVF